MMRIKKTSYRVRTTNVRHSIVDRAFRLGRQWNFLTVMLFCFSGVLSSAVTLPNSKSGISLSLDGVLKSDYAVEELYHDYKVFPRRVIYLKSDVKIDFAHNSRNVYGRNTPLTGTSANQGLIRYKIDQEGQHRRYIGDSNPIFPGPLSLSQMRYKDGSPVVGAIGDNGENRSDLKRFWTKGVRDSVGDEWHCLLVWDDDSWRDVSNEYRASDGVYHLLVVNPKTPCLTWKGVGSGQFYTTPAKNYWIPVIFDQTTYFQGEVTCEICDINGNNVFYRINGGAFIDAGSNVKILDESNFNNGENVLEYYYAGRETFKKTRKVVKNPDFPSAGENHGNLMWGNEQGWQEVKARLDKEPYKANYGRMEWSTDHHGQGRWNYRSQRRSATTHAIVNAFVAKRKGNSYSNFDRNGEGSTKPYAQFAKEMLIENMRTMDATGYESVWPGEAIPNKEQFYRGYYDVDGIFSAAFAYDIMIAQYRSDQHPQGITPIEDYLIRDCLASWSWECMHVRSGMSRLQSERGMWGNARSIGGIVIGMTMPTYTTRYYGTSGFDNQTTITYPWCPFPDQQYTWKTALFDPVSQTERQGYPNMGYKRLLEAIENPNVGLFRQTGDWADKIGYLDYSLCGHCWMILGNLSKQYYPDRNWPLMFLGFGKATKGTIKGIGTSTTTTHRRAMLLCMNKNFPQLAENNLEWIKSQPRGSKESEDKQLFSSGVYGMVWYDNDYSGGNSGGDDPPLPPPSEKVKNPTFSPQGGVFDTPQMVTLSTATENAEIYYTVDGNEPDALEGTLYTQPISVVVGTTVLRAIALKSGAIDSNEVSANYLVGSVVSKPSISPSGGGYLVPQRVSLVSATDQATIHYTMDGSTPSQSSAIYSEPIYVDKGSEIRAIAVRDNYQDSLVASANFFIGEVVSDNLIWDNWQLASPQTENFPFRVNITPASSSANTVLGLSSGIATTWSDLAVIARFAPQGIIDARNGGTYSATNEVTYTAGETYEVSFDVDFSDNTYAVKVKAPDESVTTIASKFAFRTEQKNATELGYLSIWTQNGPTKLVVLSTAPRGLRVIKKAN